MKWTNVTVDGCDFHVDNDRGANGGTAAIYISQGPSVNIFNCTFRSTGMGDNVLVDEDGSSTDTEPPSPPLEPEILLE